MEQIIDQAVADYLSQLEQSQEEFLKDVEELQNEGLSTEEILAIIAGLSIGDYWIQDLFMQNAVNRYLEATGFMLDDMVKFGKISETQLLAFRKVQESSIVTYSTRLGEEVRLGLAEGLSQNLKGNALRERISTKISLSPRRVESIVGTALASYNRSILMVMAEDLPEKESWYYHGPLDSKTRPICRVMLSNRGLTKAEVEARYPGALIDGGGFNCRHRWLPERSDPRASKTAKQEIDNNPKKYKKAKTLLEYSRGL
tara:strand:- start:48 stop:818 length:771 start_codon:yes stop_codon:yes gene_type:complete